MMENPIHTAHKNITLRKPTLKDGSAIYQLIKSSPPLDLNSSYLYLLQASHFANTCVVAECNNQIVGFVSAYIQPDDARSLFVWQIAVADKMRGSGLAKTMLRSLLENQPDDSAITKVTCTISPSNKASQRLFESFSQSEKLTLVTTPFISESHFGGENHEAEELYTLQAPDSTKLIPYLF